MPSNVYLQPYSNVYLQPYLHDTTCQLGKKKKRFLIYIGTPFSTTHCNFKFIVDNYNFWSFCKYCYCNTWSKLYDIDFLQLSTIWAETADNARSAARSFVLGGLSEKYYGLSDFWVADRINVLILSPFFFGILDAFLSL